MSRAEIISEIPKLSHTDRQEILRRILEIEGGLPEKDLPSVSAFKIRSLKGHRVLMSNIPQSELADEMFSR